MFQTKTSLKAKLLVGATSFAAFGAAAGAAHAQDTGTETVIVTGSRIPQRNIEGSSPVTTVTSEEVKLQGSTTLGDLMRTLPSVVNDGDGDTVTNGTAGLSTIDLRNLGTKRTLVLVDGKRLVAADDSLDVDTNVIPAGMVDRVEVLTGGDSAVYGSDAVAGVVNIITKKDFEGLQVDSQVSFTDNNADGLKHDTYAMLGLNSGDGKGNLTIYGEYMHRDPISEADRPYGAHALAATNYTGCAASTPATHFGGFCYSGSGTEPQGRIKTKAVGGPYAGQTTIFDTGSATLVPYAGQTFNFAPYQYYQTQGERVSMGAEGHYAINKSIDFYTRLTFAENKTQAQIGPTPITANFDINCGNPFLSNEERQTMFGTTSATGVAATDCATVAPSVLANAANGNAGVTNPLLYQALESYALRLTSAGPRLASYDHNTYQLVGGVRGDLGWSDFTYDLSAQYGHTASAQIEYNDALKGNFQNGLLALGTADAPTCVNTSASGCVPINIFSPNSLTPAMINYFRENLLEQSNVTQVDIQGAVTGDLGAWGIKSPFAKDPVGISVGAEYRQESAAVVPDYNKANGNLLGYSAATAASGEFDVAEGFGELEIPVVQGMTLAKSIDLQVAYRFSSYDKAGDTTTYRVGGKWSPVDDFAVRASFDRAVRAPNVAELFTPAGGTSSNAGRDPCSANSTVTTTAALCEATGVPAGSVFGTGLNCPTNQCQGAVGGNPFLKPEVAVTREVGVVFTPTFIPGFSATVDYYDININKYIEATPLQTILNSCYSTAINTTQSASNQYCSFIHRDALGQITTANTGYVVQAEGNIGGELVKGVDFGADYNLDLGSFGWSNSGSVNFDYRATWVLDNRSRFPGSPDVECAGFWGTQCGEPQNRFKGNLRTTYVDPTNTFSISLDWRYLSGVQFELNNQGFVNNPTLAFGAYSYFDLSGTYALSDSISLRAGVRNILGQDPPLTDNNTSLANDINGNTFPNTYDALGRVIFIGATKTF